MPRGPEPVVLELASLPREQVGPFLLLGLDKLAGKKVVEEHWADRVKWSRRMPPIIKVALEDINWARNELAEPDKRVRADVASLNADTSDGVLAALSRQYGLEGGKVERGWQPLDMEKALADYSPPADVPELESVRAALTVPPVPEEVPAVASLLERLATRPLDPWAPDLLLSQDSRA